VHIFTVIDQKKEVKERWFAPGIYATLIVQMNPQWTIETKIKKASLNEDNIIHVVYLDPQIEETLEDAKYALGEMKKKANGKRYPGLIDLTNVKSVSSEVRAYHAGRETAEVLSAVGLVVTNPIARVIGNFFLGLNKPPCPAQLFTSSEAASVWLKQFIV